MIISDANIEHDQSTKLLETVQSWTENTDDLTAKDDS